MTYPLEHTKNMSTKRISQHLNHLLNTSSTNPFVGWSFHLLNTSEWGLDISRVLGQGNNSCLKNNNQVMELAALQKRRIISEK